MNSKSFAVCGIVEIDQKVLLVRHTYGSAKGRILLPGGYVCEHELATHAIEREIREETGIETKARTLLGVQYKPDQWCSVFVMEYIGGTPVSDGYENSEVLLLSVEDAIKRPDLTNLSKQLLIAYQSKNVSALPASNYVPRTSRANEYALFVVM